MADNLNELGKELRKTKENVEAALRRDVSGIPLLHRVRDIFDPEIPFEMEFDVPRNAGIVKLNFFFLPPPDTQKCCAGCYCAICEIFTAGNTWTTGYIPLPNSVQVMSMSPMEAPYYGEEQVLLPEYFTMLDEDTVWSDTFTASEMFPIKVCYAYMVHENCVPQPA